MPSEDQMDDLWVRTAAGDRKARNKIAMHYQFMVQAIATSLKSTLPSIVSLDDLTSEGQLGLLSAIERFDPSRGFKFETFATPRIRGAMVDYLRRQDWAPRSLRGRERNIQGTVNSLEQTLGRLPTEYEIAAAVGSPVSEIREVSVLSKISSVLALDAPAEDNVHTLADMVPSADDSSWISPDEVTDIIGTLGDRERDTLTMHYFLGYSLAEIAKHYGVTESRVCQIHTEALRQLREKLLG
jgi:RNA polymerase sigma factor for flagellar operon FliA